MIKLTLQIEGMACGMCEAHVNDAVRRAVSVIKVTSSHQKGCTEILTEAEIDTEVLKSAIEAGGYRVTAIQSEEYEKKKFFLFGRK